MPKSGDYRNRVELRLLMKEFEDNQENEKGRVVAIVGRPNVGKSAIFNRIAKKRIAIVHEEAGVTRDRLMREVFWDDERFTLIDTGGIMNIDNEKIHDRIDAAYAYRRKPLKRRSRSCIRSGHSERPFAL